MRNLTVTLCLALVLLLGTVELSWSGDLDKGIETYNLGDSKTALSLLKPLAEQGDATAQLFLGYIYSEGNGVPLDYEAAVRWLSLAAEQGQIMAQIHLGEMYYNGESIATGL